MKANKQMFLHPTVQKKFMEAGRFLLATRKYNRLVLNNTGEVLAMVVRNHNKLTVLRKGQDITHLITLP